MVIDDDAEDLELISLAANRLQNYNELVLFNNAETALAYLKRASQQPAVIICDVNMPRVSGFEFRESLLNSVPALLGVPFFFLSTSRSPANAKSAEALNVNGYYEKAGSIDGLKETIYSILVRSGVMR